MLTPPSKPAKPATRKQRGDERDGKVRVPDQNAPRPPGQGAIDQPNDTERCSRRGPGLAKLRKERKAELARKRMRELRTRMKEAKKTRRHGGCDQVRFYPAPLLDSEVDELVCDLKVEKASDTPIADWEWRKLVGLVVAQAVKLAIKKKSR